MVEPLRTKLECEDIWQANRVVMNMLRAYSLRIDCDFADVRIRPFIHQATLYAMDGVNRFTDEQSGAALENRDRVELLAAREEARQAIASMGRTRMLCGEMQEEKDKMQEEIDYRKTIEKLAKEKHSETTCELDIVRLNARQREEILRADLKSAHKQCGLLNTELETERMAHEAGIHLTKTLQAELSSAQSALAAANKELERVRYLARRMIADISVSACAAENLGVASLLRMPTESQRQEWDAELRGEESPDANT